MNYKGVLCFFPLLLLFLSSCVQYEELINFNKGPAFPEEPVRVPPPPEFVVQADDLLQIWITAPNMAAAAPFNPLMSPTGQMPPVQGTGPSPIDYLVSSDGTIRMPVLGEIEVAGMSTGEITDIITDKLEPYLKDPVVKVRVTNFRVTVTGEVTQPGQVFIPEESITLLEVIGMAGDLTDFANRENVLVIREDNGYRVYERLSLHNREVFLSDFYYLQQGDVIYVEPLPEKGGILSNQARGIFTLLGGVSSVVSLLLTILVTTGSI